MKQSVADQLIDVISRYINDWHLARSFVHNYGVERVQQVLDHWKKVKVDGFVSWEITKDFFATTLKGKGLPFELFTENLPPPPNAEDRNRYENLGYSARGREHRAKVETLISGMSQATFEQLAQMAVIAEEDPCYEVHYLRNPTISNWLLCEKVYILFNRIYTGPT